MKTSKDLYEIDINLIKNTIDKIKYILQHLFNISISQGIFPNILKKSQVIVLFKKGYKRLPGIDQFLYYLNFPKYLKK